MAPDRVVDVAARLADRDGLDQLTLAAVAAELGVRTPSLYKHIAGLPALRRLLAVQAKQDLAQVLRAAAVGRSRGDALRCVAEAYREWAVRRPGLYAAAQAAPAPDDDRDVTASEEVVGVVFDVLRGYQVSDETLVDATRTLRAGLHGFVALEQAGGYAMPRPVRDSMAWWLDSLDRALSA